MTQLSLHSPVGDLTISEDDGAVVSVDWGWGAEQTQTPLLLAARDQINAYFDGETAPFNLPLKPHGTAFQQRVWLAMSAIPYGQTLTYGDIAKDLGSAARAVGGACGQNPLPILIPCHRVVGSRRKLGGKLGGKLGSKLGGNLGGYSGEGGLETKTALLRLERALS